MLEVYVDRGAVSTDRASQFSEPAGVEARGRLHFVAGEANVAAAGSVAGRVQHPGSTWLSQPYVISARAAGSSCWATRGLSSYGFGGKNFLFAG